MRVLTNELRRIGAVLSVVCTVCVMAACNDRPTDIALDLTPGTDTLYASSTQDSGGIGLTATSTSKRQPMLNSTYFLFGKTTDSDARLIIEFTNYPSLGNPADYEVIQSDLQMFPQTYRYGDTSNGAFGLVAYELGKVWSLNATWDSIWAPDGTTTYYATTDTPVAQHTQTVATTDTLLNIPFSVAATKRWLTLGGDSTTSDQLFGMALLPTETSAITQFRNLNGTNQVFRMRVIYKHKDSTDNDTTFLTSAVANFVNTPLPSADELITQGAFIHSTTFDVDVSSLPRNALILGAKLRVTADKATSVSGTLGMDELLALRYTPSNATSDVVYAARVDANGTYLFIDVTYAVQGMLRDSSTSRLVLTPIDNFELWQMNRIRLHNLEADPALRPQLSVIYTLPDMLK